MLHSCLRGDSSASLLLELKKSATAVSTLPPASCKKSRSCRAFEINQRRQDKL